MLGFIARRLISSVLVIVVASFLIFAGVANLTDPLGQFRSRVPPPPQSAIDNFAEENDLDHSVPVRYGIWISGFASGDLGESLDNQEITPLLFRRLLVTLRMVLGAAFLAALLAVVVGVFSAVRQYSPGDYAATFAGFLFLSTPVFWLAALLKEFAAIRINNLLGTTVVYTVGHQSVRLPEDFWGRMADYFGHWILPTLSLALISFAAWSRYQRASMLEVLNSDYVRLARAKGLSNRRVLTRHALRNALIPLTTVIALDFGAIFGGAVLTETIYNWPGMGQLLLEGIRASDPKIVVGWLMVTGVIVVLFNLIADLLYGVLDPRIRSG